MFSRSAVISNVMNPRSLLSLGPVKSSTFFSMIRETCSRTGTLRSLKAVVMKQPKVSAAITLREKANSEFARDSTVFIATVCPEPRSTRTRGTPFPLPGCFTPSLQTSFHPSKLNLFGEATFASQSKLLPCLCSQGTLYLLPFLYFVCKCMYVFTQPLFSYPEASRQSQPHLCVLQHLSSALAGKLFSVSTGENECVTLHRDADQPV